MPARLNHNPNLNQVHHSLATHLGRAARRIGQLSSGERIERSSDDPASLALANGIKAEIRAITEGTRNIQQSIHMLQVADGALSQLNDMILRMESLAVQGASTTYNDNDRENVNVEFQNLKAEIDRIARVTSFNGIQLLDADSVYSIQADPSETSNDVSVISIGDMRASGPTLNMGDLTIDTAASAQTSLARLRHARELVADERNRIAAFQNRQEMGIRTSESVMVRMTEAESDVRDVDMARAITDMTRSQILAQTAASFAVSTDRDVERILSLLQ